MKINENALWCFLIENKGIVPKFPDEYICVPLTDEFPYLLESWIAEHLEKKK